ncbi:MAG: acylphosphatase [Deltaproteobacteria bacterium]|nr:MAG: acylphosphatase [Deltaproteobacteria bacterium]
MSKVRVELSIQGRVQGVFYRQSTKETAIRLGLSGWTKNYSDGSVLAVFEGERVAVDAVIEWCRQGPPAAIVTNIEVKWLDFVGEFEGFGIRH